MSDLRRIVTLNRSTGLFTVVKDLEDTTTYSAVRGSFQVTAGKRNPVMAALGRRYAGAWAINETHDNAEISWTALVRGGAPALALANLESMFGFLEVDDRNTFFEWRADGATFSTYYEIRGPASYTVRYDWAQFTGSNSTYVDVKIPVGPLSVVDKIDISISSFTAPGVVQLATTIPGDAPALADISLRDSSGGLHPRFALLGWTKRATTPLSGSVAPFGFLDDSTFVTRSASLSSVADANAIGGTSSQVSTASTSGCQMTWDLDPSTLPADDFTQSIDIEVWARLLIPPGVLTPRCTISVYPQTLANPKPQYTSEFLSTGRTLVKPQTATVYRYTRLGVVTLPVDIWAPLKWTVKLRLDWLGGSTGTIGIDQLGLAPARRRACSPTGKKDDGTYPVFTGDEADATKTIYSDLSGALAIGAATPRAQHSGLGGSPIELPPGQVDLMVKLCSMVPDDPSVWDVADRATYAGITGNVRVWPRYWLAKGT